jgi:hypothetical protein
MAVRYWIGTGPWDSSSTTNWSASPPQSLGLASCSGTTLTLANTTGPTIGQSVWTQTGANLGVITAGSGTVWTVSIGGTYSSRQMVSATTGASAPTSADGVIIEATGGTGGTTTIGTGAVCLTLSYSHPGTIAFGTNSITISGNDTTVINSSTVTTITGTPTVNFNYSGATGTRIITVPAAKSGSPQLNINVTAGTDTINLGGSAGIGGLNFTGFSGTWSNTGLVTMYGSLTVSTGMTVSAGISALTFAATSGTQTITSNGKTLDFPLVFTGVGGTRQLADALTIGDTRTLNLAGGTFDANNQNVTVGLFTASNSTIRRLIMGSGLWTLSGTGTVWTTAQTFRLTFSGASCPIVLSNTTATARTFDGGGFTYNSLTIGGATGISTTTITGTNTFNTLSSTKTVAHTITFGANQTIGTWSVTGTSGNVVTVNSSVSNTARTLTITNQPLGIDYLDVRDITTNLAPVIFYAGANTILRSNVQGVAAIAPTVNKYIYVLNSGTSWTVPADWNNANNEIHLFGGGGGGGGGTKSPQVGGGGGGGGGYTKDTNISLTPGSSVSYEIGAAGTGGAGNNTAGLNGVAGGNTTFNSGALTAAGGNAGQAALAPPAAGGSGGTGSTNSGGNGNGGARTNGGPGGGAGGPLGTGGNGGVAFDTDIRSCGSGGGGNGGGTAGIASGPSTVEPGGGGNNAAGVGGSASEGSGFNGGGGCGGSVGNNSLLGTVGTCGIDITTAGLGSGGGSGGGDSNNGVRPAGLYGGGGGGGGVSTTSTGGKSGGLGGQGAIIIVYTLPPPPPPIVLSGVTISDGVSILV